jgi:methionyl-tRNA formyltransferase
VRAALLNGDEVTGVSVIRLVRKLDAGPIVRQEELEIEAGEDAAALSDRLAVFAASLLPQTCLDWISGTLTPVEQDESLATMTREWTRVDARIDWSAEALHIERLVRASQPWPVAWSTLSSEPFRIHAAAIANGVELPPGRVQRIGKRIVAGCGAGALELVTVQPAGKRAMPAAGWWNGVQAAYVQFSL